MEDGREAGGGTYKVGSAGFRTCSSISVIRQLVRVVEPAASVQEAAPSHLLLLR